ncbi:unnamed protein product, partial [Owenia fusiformis]
ENVNAAIKALENFEEWADTEKSKDDQFDSFFEFDAKLVRKQILIELRISLERVSLGLGPLGEVLLPFLETFNDVVDSIQDITKALRGLKEGYELSKSLIDNVFGPKIAKRFPRKYLESEKCGNGFYPSTQRGNYEYDGAQLQVDAGTKIVVPFSGRLFISGQNQVTIHIEEM